MPDARAVAHRCARAVAVVGALVCAAGLVSPTIWGVAALCAAAAACAAPGENARLAAVEDAACVGFMALMFGPAGAGGFALVRALTVAPLAIGLREARPATALILATGIAALLSVLIPVLALENFGGRWGPFAAMAPAFVLAAPATILRRMTSGVARFHALGPMLVALVIGAGLGGLRGAAIAWTLAQLATPLALLILSGRPRPALFALGVLGAGLSAAAATGVAWVVGGQSIWAAPPAVGIGLIVYALALRVHAPGGWRRLVGPVATPSRLIPRAPAPAR